MVIYTVMKNYATRNWELTFIILNRDLYNVRSTQARSQDRFFWSEGVRNVDLSDPKSGGFLNLTLSLNPLTKTPVCD